MASALLKFVYLWPINDDHPKMHTPRSNALNGNVLEKCAMSLKNKLQSKKKEPYIKCVQTELRQYSHPTSGDLVYKKPLRQNVLLNKKRIIKL